MLNMIKGNTKRAIQGNPIKGAVVAVVDSSFSAEFGKLFSDIAISHLIFLKLLCI